MSSSRGAALAALAYVCWGLFPLYWKHVAHVPAAQVMAHRVVWSFVSLALLAGVRGRIGEIGAAARVPGVLRTYAAAAVLISANWYLFIWGVGHGRVVETSLGYFINPLVSVGLGVVLFQERLRPLQWTAIALAAGGVLYLAFDYGNLPWLALSLAVTFALYGAVKKRAPLGAENGLTLETSILVLPALGYLLFADASGAGAWGRSDPATTAFLTGGGLVTTIPLLLFAAAMPTLQLSAAGILQYIMPTLQFLSGVVIYSEPFTAHQRLGFGAVWAGCVLFALDITGRREPSEPRRNP
jgi:chloramphenicol-sensitive protein RarD